MCGQTTTDAAEHIGAGINETVGWSLLTIVVYVDGERTPRIPAA